MTHSDSFRRILDYAITQETEAHEFYKKLSKQVEKFDLQEKLKNFALDEFQHKIHLEAVRDGQVSINPDEVGSLEIAESLIDIQPHDDMKYDEILALAIRKEHAAQQLYTKLANASQKPEIKQLFTLLAQEEAKHKLALEIEYDLTTF